MSKLFFVPYHLSGTCQAQMLFAILFLTQNSDLDVVRAALDTGAKGYVSSEKDR